METSTGKQCAHCGKHSTDVKLRHYSLVGGAENPEATRESKFGSGTFNTCDPCDRDAGKFDSNMMRWLENRLRSIDSP